jgi:ABC-2 type transport system permease protein
VLGVTISSGEFRHHTATLTYLAAPSRARVLAAKAAAGGIAAAVCLSHLAGAALLGVIGVVVGSLIRSQLATVVGVFAWTIIIESLIGGLFGSVRPYLPYTAATALAGTPLGSASFGPSRGVSGVAPLPFAAATALLAAIAIGLALIAARTTIRRDVS